MALNQEKIDKLKKALNNPHISENMKKDIEKAIEELRKGTPVEEDEMPGSTKYLKKATIIWQEGLSDKIVENKEYTNWSEFEKQIASTYEEGMGYSKNKIELEWDNGDIFIDRIDVGSSEGDWNPNAKSLKEYFVENDKQSLGAYYKSTRDKLLVDGDLYEYGFKPGKTPSKKRGVKSLLSDEPKKSDDPSCEELLEKFKKRKAQAKKYAKKKPDTPAEILKKAAERAKTRIKKSPAGKPTKAQTSSIEKAIEDFLVLIKNDKEAIKKLISKLQKLL